MLVPAPTNEMSSEPCFHDPVALWNPTAQHIHDLQICNRDMQQMRGYLPVSLTWFTWGTTLDSHIIFITGPPPYVLQEAGPHRRRGPVGKTSPGSHPNQVSNPTGLLIALCLGQQGIPTLVLEAYHELYPTTCAIAYMPTINSVISSLGLIPSVSEHAFLNHQGITWQGLDGSKIANLPFVGQDGEFGGVHQIGQARMNALILENIKECSSVKVKLGLKCVRIDDDLMKDSIRVMCHTAKPPDDDVFIKGAYIIGTDGANSAMRRLCCIPFEGYTFDEFNMIGADVLFDFEKEMKYAPMNFFVDPEEWGVIAYTGEKGDRTEKDGEEKVPQWRAAWVEPPNLPAEKMQCLERATNRISKFMKGRKDFRIVRAESYWIHQRCAAQGRKGRVLLVGDALHSNNPIGGLGLTGGILDSLVHGNALTRVLKGGENRIRCSQNARRVSARHGSTRLRNLSWEILSGWESLEKRRRRSETSFSAALTKIPSFLNWCGGTWIQ
ncbi:hypothetical protein BCR34DRAFT_588878 [Clohesyomyces aquaticus]|uniref:FAD-binding domain-containing protein n=1 Tax=Clohesyomyces aquaticus TaxID=1231657 RepID=A0A1Y1ZIN5_9PLEO|nr:hypothetical protein BCR34DRAFT_588878 [Clohesyomyces aquaticus]